MCLLAFAWRPGQPQPLLVLANRDEFYARPSQALSEVSCGWLHADAPVAVDETHSPSINPS